MNIRIMITVVIPSSARPQILSISAQTLNIAVIKSITNPSTVTICIGAVEYAEIFEIAYFKRPTVDHFESPSSLSLTSNSTVALLKPTQNEIALKNPFLSGIRLRVSTTLRSRSLRPIASRHVLSMSSS